MEYFSKFFLDFVFDTSPKWHVPKHVPHNLLEHVSKLMPQNRLHKTQLFPPLLRPLQPARRGEHPLEVSRLELLHQTPPCRGHPTAPCAPPGGLLGQASHQPDLAEVLGPHKQSATVHDEDDSEDEDDGLQEGGESSRQTVPESSERDGSPVSLVKLGEVSVSV